MLGSCIESGLHLHFYEQNQLSVDISSIESVTIEHLLYTYLELQKFTEKREDLFCLLQQAISQAGKEGFALAIEDGMIQLLGERPEYFIPVLMNADVSIVKNSPLDYAISYRFEQVVLKKGERRKREHQEKAVIITQPLRCIKGEWVSPDPTVEVKAKGKVP